MTKNLRRLLLAVLTVTLTGAIGVGAATIKVNADDTSTLEAVDAFTGYNITLKDSIAINYHFTVPSGYTAAEIAFTRGEGGSTVVEPKKDLTAGDEVVFVLDDIAPYEMTKSITAKVIWTADDGKTGVEEITEHSVSGYLETLLKNSLDSKVAEIDTQEKFDALKSLASSTLAYGDAAQTYVGLTASSTANLTTSEKNAAIKATASSSDLAFEGEASSDVAFTGATLVFGDKVDLVFYFKVSDEFAQGKILGAFVENEFIEATVCDESDTIGTEYAVTYKGLSVVDFDKVVKATVAYKTDDSDALTKVGKTVKYSVKSYVNRINASTTASDNMKSLANAAYSYGVATSDYVSALSYEKDYNGEKVTLTTTTDTSSYYTYLRDCSLYGFTPKFDLSFINKAGTGFGSSYIHSATTDGQYLYYLTCGAGKATDYSRSYYIIKYDPVGDKVIGRSASFDARKGSGDWNSDTYLIVYYKEGAIYVYDKANTLLSVSVNDFDSTGTVAPTAVENAPVIPLTSVAGMAYRNGRYATLNSSGSLSIYNESDFSKAVATVQCTVVPSQGGSAMRLTTSGNYLYALSLTNGCITPTVTVVDWSGQKVGTITPDVTREFLGFPDTYMKNVNGEYKEVAYNDFNVQNFVVIGDKAYIVMYAAAFNDKGITPLITATLTEQRETTETERTYSLAERGVVRKEEKGITIEATTTLAKTYGSELGKGNFVYAAATDGKYAYFVGSGDAKTAAYITKYDLAANKKIAASASIGAITESNVYAFVKDGFIYVYSAVQGKVFRISTDFVDGDSAVETKLTFDGITDTITGAYYSNKRNEYAVLAGNAIHVYGENMVEKYSFSVPSSMTVKNYAGTDMTGNTKFLVGEDNYLYVCYYSQGSVTPGVVAYSFTGEKVYSGIIENDVHMKSNAHHKLESMISVDGALYFTILSWSDKSDETPINGTALFKTTFDSTKEEKISLSLGEYYEKSGTIALSDTTVAKLSSDKISETNHGFTTDGVYGYISVSASATQANVVKFKLETNEVVGYVTAPLTTAGVSRYNFGHNLFVYGNDIYIVVREDKTTYKIDTDEFDTTGKKTMTEVKGFFGGEITYAEAAYYDSANDLFAVRVGQDLYVGKKDSLKKVSSTMTGKLAGIYGDNDYIYVLAETDGSNSTAAVKVEIYDWSGKKITKTANTDFKPMNGAKSNNVQGMFAVNGKCYFLVCQWGAGTDADDKAVSAGAYVVSGYFDYSLIK